MTSAIPERTPASAPTLPHLLRQILSNLVNNALEAPPEACIAAGMNGYLAKPMKTEKLIIAIPTHCGRN